MLSLASHAPTALRHSANPGLPAHPLFGLDTPPSAWILDPPRLAPPAFAGHALLPGRRVPPPSRPSAPPAFAPAPGWHCFLAAPQRARLPPADPAPVPLCAPSLHALRPTGQFLLPTHSTVSVHTASYPCAPPSRLPVVPACRPNPLLPCPSSRIRALYAASSGTRRTDTLFVLPAGGKPFDNRVSK
ncbi:hypothetical protein C8R44DRAFT_893225 [Mycena epipterygia]|nr:hypothetical protein C8R44DRAFT_893225 [Mycena epipterygia]